MQKPQLRILAIDDTPPNLALLGLALEDDYIVQIATSGAKGLELAKDDPPDLILLDIMMPDMDGFETCSRLKTDPALKHIPIIFITALTDKNAEIDGLALGAADYITKPIDINIARLRIHNLMERERLRIELEARAIEDTDLIVTLGEWVMAAALTQIEIWQSQGLQIKISVNVAPRHLLQDDFVDTLKTLFAAHPSLAQHCLELDVLESAGLEDIGRVCQVMQACQAMGITFALDDFGTGYSSLTYLKALPAETLKIDQSFIRDILNDPDDLAIVEGIIKLSGIFHRQVVAEGVEAVGHGLLLQQLGCELAQGFGIAQPMPAAALPEWIKNWQPGQNWQNR